MTHKQRLALWATIVGSGVVFLDGSIVNLALPKMASELQVSFSGLQWVMDGYLLSLSALILLGGSLGDIFGRKRIYMIGLIGFLLTSVLCGFAPNMAWLVTGRILQGVFGALMVPGALAIINTNFSEDQRSKAIGFWTACTSAVIALGPLLGGFLVDRGSWRLIFFINVPLLIICFALGFNSIKETRDESQRRVDIGGVLLAMTALGAICYGLIEGPVTQWNWLTVLALFAGFTLAGLFIWYEKRQRDPMLDLSLFRSSNFTGVNLTTFAMYGALGGFFFILLIYLQTVVGFSSLEAGLSMLPISILLAMFSSRVGTLVGKFGPRIFMTIGPLLAGIGILLLLPLGPESNYLWHILPGVLLFGSGMALTVAPLTITVLASVTTAQSGIASAVNNAVSRVAGLVVIALLGLFGAAYAYQFATILCAVLAITAGVLSWVLIKDPPKQRLPTIPNV